MNYKYILLFIIIFCHNSLANDKACQISDNIINKIITQIKESKDKASILQNFPRCYKANRNLMLKISIIDPDQFKYADNTLRDDEIFISRILKVQPTILRYASYNLRNDQEFMRRSTYIQRDSLNYASLKLLDNVNFMTKMITIDSRNYIFASPRIKADKEIAKIAFEDDGSLIRSAPDEIKKDIELVKIAIKSNKKAFKFIDKELRKNKDLKEMSKNVTSIKSYDKLKEFLQENYIDKKDDFLIKIINQGKFFSSNQLVDRKYITKWVSKSQDDNNEILSLVKVLERNYPQSWKSDFANYPLLRDKVFNFFKKRDIDTSTIDNMKTTYFWVVKNDLPTIAFNIYGIRPSKDNALGEEFSDVSSLTVIAQKQNERWNMSVIEVIFSSEIKFDLSFINGHKRYIIWDLYKIDDNDQNPKIIFKVEDDFKEYFEVYEEQNGGKYNKIFVYEPD